MILQNALVYTPRHTFERGTIIIRDGRIVPFAAPEEPRGDPEQGNGRRCRP